MVAYGMDKLYKQANGHPTVEDMDETWDENWENFEREVERDLWINRNTIGEENLTTLTNNSNLKSKVDTWDFPLSLMNNAYSFKKKRIQDSDFQRQLSAGDPFEVCSNKYQESTCCCDYVEKVIKCSKCQKIFCAKCYVDPCPRYASTLSQDNQKQKPQQMWSKQPMSTSGLPNQQKLGSNFPIGEPFLRPQGYPQPPAGPFNNPHGIYPPTLPAPPVRILRDPYSPQNQMGQSQLGYYPSVNQMQANMFPGQMPQIRQQVNAGPNPNGVPFKHIAPPIIPTAVSPTAIQTIVQKNRNSKIYQDSNNLGTKDPSPLQNRLAQNFPNPAQFRPCVNQTTTGNNCQKKDPGRAHQSKHLYYQKPIQDKSSEKMTKKASVSEKPGGGKDSFIVKDLDYSQRNSIIFPRKFDDILSWVENKGQKKTKTDNTEILQGFARMDLSEVD